MHAMTVVKAEAVVKADAAAVTTVIPPGVLTRFAPAPSGYLHLGHVANALWTWGLARAVGGRVLLRIEDHDRVRSRPVYDAAILEDLAWLGFEPDVGPVRQSSPDALAAYAAACDRLTDGGFVYGCACTRSTFTAWVASNGQPWSGPGCPGACRERELAGPVLRVALGDGSEAWADALVGPCADAVAGAAGDLAIRDRDGNWTYGFCVVVDDLRQGVGLVVRGMDLLPATAGQIRLGHLLGRGSPPVFAHHRLIHRPDGTKLSKSAGDTGVRALRAAGRSREEVLEMAANVTGWVRSTSSVPAPAPADDG
jgi:glutamyl/glutaminyl-tRNA synthetase